MNSTSLTFVFLLLVFFVENEGASDNLQTPPQHNKLRIPEIFQQNDALQSQIDNCDTYVIFDLSKNVVTKEIFDVSIKMFLKYILQYCNGFKFVVIDDNFNGCGSSQGCNVTFTKCDESNKCEKVIENLNYTIVTSAYSNKLIDDISDDAIAYRNVLDKIFADVSLCENNGVVILTNRIVPIQLTPVLLQTIKNSGLKLIPILLGRDVDAVATTLFHNLYKNVTNAKILILPNYDCLSYLLYCLLPCSAKTPDCLQTDIDDCKIPVTKPNYYPSETLHIWYVLNFIEEANMTDIVGKLRDNIIQGFNNINKTIVFKRARIRFIFNSDNITQSFDDIYAIYNQTFKYFLITGDVVNDDEDYCNEQLDFIPWSGTLIETRIGMMAVIILTNYATKTLAIAKVGQTLQGQIYVYNPKSFNYYSEYLKNETNLNVYSLNYSDSVTLISKPKFYTSTSSTTKSATLPVTSASTSAIATTTLQNIQEKSSKTIIIIICVATIGILITISFVGFFVYRCKRRQWKADMELLQMSQRKRSLRRRLTTKKDDEWELTWDQLVIKDDNLASNSRVKIFYGEFINKKPKGNIEVAIKIPSTFSTHFVKKNLLHEINVMKLVSEHTNIVELIGCITLNDEICLVLEFCTNLDLLNFVKELNYNKNDVVKAKKSIRKEFFIFAWQISHGLNYLASKKIIHRNLTAKNILIDSQKNAKISDFGLAIQKYKKADILSDNDKARLATKWMAIESLKNYIFSFQSDIWAFGIILYEMYSFGQTPYAGVTDEELLNFLAAENRLQKPDFTSDEIYEIMLNCWSEDASLRPTANEIIQVFSKFLQQSTEGYGYIDLLESAVSNRNKELIRQFSSCEEI